MPCRVGQEIADDLGDAPPVRHDRGQVRLNVYNSLENAEQRFPFGSALAAPRTQILLLVIEVMFP